MMDRKDIIELSVDKCISVYDEMVTEIRETDGYSKIYGSAPKILLIKYGAGSMKKFDFVLTDIWNAWCYSDGKLEVAEKMREPVRKPVSGMFFAEASAEFMIDTEKQHVYLSITLDRGTQEGSDIPIRGRNLREQQRFVGKKYCGCHNVDQGCLMSIFPVEPGVLTE